MQHASLFIFYKCYLLPQFFEKKKRIIVNTAIENAALSKKTEVSPIRLSQIHS